MLTPEWGLPVKGEKNVNHFCCFTSPVVRCTAHLSWQRPYLNKWKCRLCWTKGLLLPSGNLCIRVYSWYNVCMFFSLLKGNCCITLRKPASYSVILELPHSPTLTLFYTGRHLLSLSWDATKSHFNPLLLRQTPAPSLLSCHTVPLYPSSTQADTCSVILELPHSPTLTLFYAGRHLLRHSWVATHLPI